MENYYPTPPHQEKHQKIADIVNRCLDDLLLLHYVRPCGPPRQEKVANPVRVG